jgi:hypothetical protein
MKDGEILLSGCVVTIKERKDSPTGFQWSVKVSQGPRAGTGAMSVADTRKAALRDAKEWIKENVTNRF